MTSQSDEIRNFILKNVTNHPKDISTITAKHFGITRQAAHRHITKLTNSGLLLAEGLTRSRQYKLKPFIDFTATLKVNNLEEDKVWRKYIRSLLKNIPSNVLTICQHGFTGMVNNVIDHSEGTELTIAIEQTNELIEINVTDNGVGIFNKIQKEFDLDDPLHSILELSKGKLTTDPERHSGEGIFFTSRMFDLFVISSGNIYFAHMGEDDYLLEHQDKFTQGTSIKMQIDTSSKRIVQQVFNAYTTSDSYGFSKTIVPVFLSAYGDENLVSRSQAKRLLVRFEVFKEIVLDFTKVESIGQAFANEIFIVYRQQNPNVHIYPIRANDQVQNMIKHVVGDQE